MILVDTSIIVAWLDPSHPHHKACWTAIRDWAGKDELGLSSVSYAELAAGSRTREAVNEMLTGFVRLELDFDSAWRAGHVYRRFRPDNKENPVLPDFFIRAQASVLSIRHLTNDRRRLSPWPEVEFIFPDI